MGRRVRDSRLETVEARKRLRARHEPYWRLIHPGLHLGYRKGQRSAAWVVRLYRKTRDQGEAPYTKAVIGAADDYLDPDGTAVLSFAQAQTKAVDLASDGGLLPKSRGGALTVRQAATHYLEWFEAHKKSLRTTKAAIDTSILPEFGDDLVANLTAEGLKKWHRRLATLPPRRRTGKGKPQRHGERPRDHEERRARQASANRILTVLKALLNRVREDGLVKGPTPWRDVKPFQKVDAARVCFLTDADAVRLVNVCGADLRRLVQGALYTGARYGELVAMRAGDVNVDTKQVYIRPGKSGLGRHVPLNAEGLAFFTEAIAGKPGDALVFTKDGGAWGANHAVRPLAAACNAAKVTPPANFHALRHTFASHLVQAGVSLQVVAKLLGHADTRITEKHYAHLRDEQLANAVALLPSYGHQPSGVVNLADRSQAKPRNRPARRQREHRA